MEVLSGPEGLIYGFVFDRRGGARALAWNEVGDWSPEQGVLWLHFDYTEEAAQHWLRECSGLDPLVANALLTEDTRPRTTVVDNGLLVALRGVNLNPQANPEDMVSIRLYVSDALVVSTRKRRLLSVADMVGQMQVGRGPRSSAEFLLELADRLVDRMSDTVDEFEDRVADLEEQVLHSGDGGLRQPLAQLRRQTIGLRRYLAPEREALVRMASEPLDWLDEGFRLRMREVSDRLVRHIEDLDAVRERAAVTQEELLSRLSDQLNSRLYVLSLVAAIFLPLGFLTGLLGVNVGGIPGADNPRAFVEFSILLLILVALQVWIFRRKRWL
ncbi:zinc transporter ZntB [Marinobacterium nitratireducens]|uniref:Zinc transporter ZntB n=1 Tax=Marinobacterium nitratireducens TaxID=518897 RepID=A0A918DWK1_9GAMM|nr:zinc transporter ZntB [Marinobacterium nitratireducens]GGO85819.1 zinc transporter ZntB [Marinobacterium nitratireducens]